MLNSRRLALGLFCSTALMALAGSPRLNDELSTPRAKFSSEKLTLTEVLAELQKQTGNPVGDARTNRTNPALKLPQTPMTFWQTLDAVGTETGIGFSPFQPGGGVALVDSDYRAVRTHYSGPLRVAFKRIGVFKDEETLTHQCRVVLNVAWEPRVPLLYLNLDETAVRHKAMGRVVEEKLAAQAAKEVAGTCATDVEVVMKAPERATREIDKLSGTIRMLGAAKMLEFAFKELPLGKDVQKEEERVKVSVRARKKSADVWLIEVTPEHPKGAIPIVESFQDLPLRTWLFNRVWLSWSVGGKTITMASTGERDSDKGSGIVYSFSGANVTLPPADAAVTLHFRTPNHVQTFRAPFVLENLPLP